jgi:hypothetical protein
MTRRSTTLESRLTEWAKEYTGYVREASIGWPGASPMAQIMKYHGRAPQGLNPRGVETNTAADEVERAVRALQAQDKGWAPACIIRCEYFEAHEEKHVRLSHLRSIGVIVREVGYSQHLRIAKVHVAAWLRVPFDEPVSEEERLGLAELMLGGLIT